MERPFWAVESGSISHRQVFNYSYDLAQKSAQKRALVRGRQRVTQDPKRRRRWLIQDVTHPRGSN